MSSDDHRPLYLECALKYGLWSGDTPPSAFYGPINITKLETTPIKQDDDELPSNMAGTVGETLDSVPKPTESGTLSMEFNSMPGKLLALVVGATAVGTLTQASGAVTDEAVTTVLDVWVPLANQYISSTGFSLKTSGDVAVSSTKYEVDLIDGMIRALHVDAVGVDMKASYTKEATTGETYEAGKAASAYLMLRGRAYEKRSHTWGRLLVAKASVSNKAAYDWVKGGWAKGTLEGKILTPSNYNSPIIFQKRNT